MGSGAGWGECAQVVERLNVTGQTVGVPAFSRKDSPPIPTQCCFELWDRSRGVPQSTVSLTNSQALKQEPPRSAQAPGIIIKAPVPWELSCFW